jgi:predicted MFS family arabinose efflux permease
VAPQIAPVVLGLNTSCSYLGVSVGGVIGAIGIQMVDAHQLGFVGAVLIIVALVAAEIAGRSINAANLAKRNSALASA